MICVDWRGYVRAQGLVCRGQGFEFRVSDQTFQISTFGFRLHGVGWFGTCPDEQLALFILARASMLFRVSGSGIRDSGMKKKKGFGTGLTLTSKWRSWSSSVGDMRSGRIWLKSGPGPNSRALSVICEQGRCHPLTRKVVIRLPGKENSNSHGARPVHQII